MRTKLDALQHYFNTGKTLDKAHRLHCLQNFEQMLNAYEDDFINAVYADFKKPKFETLATEIAMLKTEIGYFKKNITSLIKPKRVVPSLLNVPSTDYLQYHPYGVVLIISPWNYPLLLSLQPVLAALVSGNCVVLKQSEFCLNTAKIVEKALTEFFSDDVVCIVQGGVAETTELLKLKFDKIFFTGSTAVGKVVYEAAAKHLTPVVLELGGKSPCVITKNANLKTAAKRIAFGKFVNAGQTCIAPDFIYIDKNIQEAFINELKLVLKEFYGDKPQQSKDFARIINQKNYNRLKDYLKDADVVIGDLYNDNDLFIEPTVIKVTDFDDDVMQNEIFGPILPIITYQDLSEIITHNHNNPKPLAFYVFTTDKKEADLLLNNCAFGGASVNDCLTHIINHRLPFGGVGSSGMGSYHGKFSFEAFSHLKGIVHRSNWFDLKLKYPPYHQKSFNLLKKVLRYF